MQLTCLNSILVFQITFIAGLTVLYSKIPHERQAEPLGIHYKQEFTKEISKINDEKIPG
jgi:hypothetical protein